jgi:exonuclease III
MYDFKNFNLRISAINVNTMNVSTIGTRNAKIFLKIEGITGKRSDIIFMSDIRAANKQKEIEDLFRVTRNGNYVTYFNSSKSARGVGIAIRRKISHKVYHIRRDEGEENYILLDLEIKGKRLTLGSVYGPNENNVNFYRKLKREIQEMGNPVIIGGDFNTILDQDGTVNNLDRMGIGRVPNRTNSNFLNEWIREGKIIEPFRALYPEQREISYLSYRGVRDDIGDGRARTGVEYYGKTRLDFFLVDSSIMEYVKSVRYEDRLSADFDHKEVLLIIGKVPPVGKVTIYDSTLSDSLSESIGMLALYDTYANHLSERDGELDRNLTQLDILIRNAELIKIILLLERGDTREMEERLGTTMENILVVTDRLRGLNMLEREYQCDYRTLYEVAMMGIKNKLMEVQARMKRDKNRARENLVRRVDYFSGKFGALSVQAEDCRRELLRFDDLDLKNRAGKFRDFLMENNEKSTGAFCRLNKEGGLNDDIEQIKGTDGQDFVNNEVRGKHIGEFYSELYKRKLDYLFSIEEFLYGDGQYEEWVEGRKLTEEEKISLEGEVSVVELENALETSNLKSTSGWDGLSFKVLKKFWRDIKGLTLKMVNETFREGELTETFKMGLIKMIPKKGNPSKVGDWRPITLLCCGYKLVSGIVALRLEKYLMKMIGRAQKGFLKAKNINTCTMNIINSINGAWDSNEPTGILCVDFSKAFDSIEHEAISNILKFFNFGQGMVKMVMTLLKGRKARVIMGDGYSTDINIQRGTPQGDRASPFIFIIAIEVLLIKIRLMDGRGIDCCMNIVRRVNAIDLEKLTAEAYADDLTIIFQMSDRSVGIILRVLENFYRMSGLALNKGKTQLLVAGSEDWPTGINVQGITVVDKVCVLGVEIDRRLVRLNENWDNVIEKMRRYCIFWGNFGLSISGRVMAVKTYVISQAVYLMGILPLPVDYGERMNELIIEFVKGSDRQIERRRTLLCEELGGYGVIDMNILNTSMKCAWIKRWKKEKTENVTDYPMCIIFGEDDYVLDCLDRRRAEETGLQLLIDIMDCWQKFKTDFYKMGRNREEIILFENRIGEGMEETLETRIFGRNRYAGLRDRLKEVRYRDLHSEDGMLLDMIVINRRLGLNINWAEYFRLRAELEQIEGIMGERIDEEEGRSLDEMVMNKARGCKKFRMAMVGRRSLFYKENDPREIASGRTLLGNGIEEMSRIRIELNFGAWKINFLDSRFKEFLFRLMQGKLYVNQILANFTEVMPQCTFCVLIEKRRMKQEMIEEGGAEWMHRINRQRHESVIHLFWECTVVRSLIDGVGNWLANTNGRLFKKDSFFSGIDDLSPQNMRICIIIVHYVKYVLYECKLRHQIPTMTHMRYEMEGLGSLFNGREDWREQVEDIPELVYRMMEDVNV